MRKQTLLMAALSAGLTGTIQTQVLAMEHGQMKHGAMNSEAMEQTETSGVTQGEGVINSVDADGRSVNITHEPIPALSWPAMTMDLPVTEHVDLGALSAGERIDFKIMLGPDNVYRITEISKAESL